VDLEQRVAELERRATRYRNALLLMVVGVCAVAVVGATTDDGMIRGQSLFLQNEQGETVIYAGPDVEGNGLFVAHSKTGTDLIRAGATTEGHGRLTVRSKTGTDLIQAGATTIGNGLLAVRSKTGTELFYAGAGTTTGDGLLRVRSNTGTDLIYAGADADGDGLLRVHSKTGRDLIYAGGDTDGTGFLFEGYNKTGEGVVQLFVDDYGNGVVGAYNRKGKGRTLESR